MRIGTDGARPVASDSSAPDGTRRTLIKGMAATALLFGMPGGIRAMGGMPKGAAEALVSREEMSKKIAAETGLSRKAVAQALAAASFRPDIIRRIKTPYESKPYADYRPLFVNRKLSGLGREYLLRHHKIFTAAERKYGVEREIIAAILGMETRYGRNRGRDKVLDSLYTLAAGYPRRADFFRGELGHFLLLCNEEHLNPAEQTGSYAGAFGTTQFIPSSYRHFAVDADGDGKRDVWDSPADIIGSVANYFHEHHWQSGRPVAQWLPKSALLQHALRKQAKKGLKDWLTLADLRRKLPRLAADWQDDDKVTLIEMSPAGGKRLALVHYNFYVITRWNRSYNYAMAVTELADMLGCKRCDTRA